MSSVRDLEAELIAAAEKMRMRAEINGAIYEGTWEELARIVMQKATIYGKVVFKMLEPSV